MTTIRHVIVRGRVQGVGFRALVGREAVRRGLGGWGPNARAGSVGAVFAGEPAVVADMIEVCRRGPRLSRVDRLDQRDAMSDELKLRAPGDLFSVLF